MNTGGPAFPSKKRVWIDGYATKEFEPVEGMTLRDYFAAKAMQGFVSREASNPKAIYLYAEYAYEMADAMLKAREL
jgi:hypothetical protein